MFYILSVEMLLCKSTLLVLNVKIILLKFPNAMTQI